jgi:hypothetical protein
MPNVQVTVKLGLVPILSTEYFKPQKKQIPFIFIH